MRRTIWQFVCTLLLALSWAAFPAMAQHRPVHSKIHRPSRRWEKNTHTGAGNQSHKNDSDQQNDDSAGNVTRAPANSSVAPSLQQEARKAGLPSDWLVRLREMSPEEQERFMNNNQHFQSLPSARQAEIRSHLQQWNNLSPEQRQAFRDRLEVWQRISPEEQERVRQQILPQWQQISPERRRVLMQHLNQLRALSEPERSARLNDPAFLQDLSAEEQIVLRKLSEIKVGGAPGTF